YCEPQAATSGYRVLASKKPVKHVGNIFRQDTSAIILNRHVHISAIVKNANIRLSECVGVFDRIFDQAFECARHFFTIAVNRTHWIRSLTAHIEGFLLDQWLQSPQCLHHQFFDVDVGLAIHLPGISEPGEAKDVFDKPLEASCFFREQHTVFGYRAFGQVTSPGERRSNQADACKWSLQLVSDHSHKVSLHSS